MFYDYSDSYRGQEDARRATDSADRAVVYIRSATTSRVVGKGIKAGRLSSQKGACIEFAKANGWRIVDVVCDLADGASLDRPGILRIRQLLEKQLIDVVVTQSPDRLSRHQKHLDAFLTDIEQAGARLEFVAQPVGMGVTETCGSGGLR